MLGNDLTDNRSPRVGMPLSSAILGALLILLVGLVAGSVGGYLAGRESMRQAAEAARDELAALQGPPAGENALAKPAAAIRTPAAPEKAPKPAPVSRDEFRVAVMGKPVDLVTRALGQPDDLLEADGTDGKPLGVVFYYSQRTFDPANMKTDKTATVTFRNGVATELSFD
jgi:hypothetical protein